MFRRLFSRLPWRRRYHGDAAWVRPDLSNRTEATWYERVIRALRRKEEFGYDEREARAAGWFRHAVLAVLLTAWLWFFVRSLLALNIFAG